jgi:hypothetical protein
VISRQIGPGLASLLFQVFAFAHRETGNLNLPEP